VSWDEHGNVQSILLRLWKASQRKRRCLKVAAKVDIEPAVPAIHGDPPMVHDALATLLGDAIRCGSVGSALELSLAREKGDARITLDGATASDRTPRLILAERVIVASGGRIAKDDGNLRIVFPL